MPNDEIIDVDPEILFHMKRRLAEEKMRKESKHKYYRVYLDGHCLGHTAKATKKARIAWIKAYITSTHMGEWRKCFCDYHYHTTIGRTYTFMLVHGPKEEDANV